MAERRFMASSQVADYACLSVLAKSPKTNKPLDKVSGLLQRKK
jgi:hypothetical protein